MLITPKCFQTQRFKAKLWYPHKILTLWTTVFLSGYSSRECSVGTNLGTMMKDWTLILKKGQCYDLHVDICKATLLDEPCKLGNAFHMGCSSWQKCPLHICAHTPKCVFSSHYLYSYHHTLQDSQLGEEVDLHPDCVRTRKHQCGKQKPSPFLPMTLVGACIFSCLLMPFSCKLQSRTKDASPSCTEKLIV